MQTPDVLVVRGVYLRPYTIYCILKRDRQALELGRVSARADIQALPAEAQRQLGYDLRLVQLGLMPRDWKPMATIGPGVSEIRARARYAALRRARQEG